MPLLFALAGIALTALAIAVLVRRRRVDDGNAPKSGDAHLSALQETFAASSKGFFDYRMA